MNMMPGSMMTGHMQAGQPGGHPMQAGQPVHSIIPGHSMQTGQSVVHSMQPGQAGHSMQHMQPQLLMQGGGHSMTPGMPVSHLMQPGHQGQQPQQHMPTHQPSSDIDSVTKFKCLIPQLKDALQVNWLYILRMSSYINVLSIKPRHVWYGGGNLTTAEEVFRFQCLFPNPNWLVWKSIPPPETRSNTHGWITGWWQYFH